MTSPSLARPFAIRTMLVVNADPNIEDLLAKFFEPGAWCIRHAPDNATALNIARVSSFDLILTSQKTSVSADVELLRKIRAVRPHTRLIILTDQGTPEDVINSMRAHAFSYFSTPFSFDALAHMIRTALEQPTWDDGIEVLTATPEWVRVRARCDFKTADRLLQFLEELVDLPETESHAFALASREILLNAIEHGGGLDPANTVEIEYVRARHMVMCHIADPGKGFSFGELAHAAVANPPDNPLKHEDIREQQGMRSGGYGVLLAQHLVDELIYSAEGNEVVLVKYLDFTCKQFA
jgi:DNA-binding response OmpR family regulator